MSGAFAPLPLRLGGAGIASAQHARVCADMVAVSRVMPLAEWTYLQATATTGSMVTYRGMNGSGLAHAPTATAVSASVIEFVYDSQLFEDEYGVQQPFKIRQAMAQIMSADNTTARLANVTIITNGIRVRGYTHAGAVGDSTRRYAVRIW